LELTVVNRRLKAGPMVLAFASAMALLACGGSPANANAPGASVSINVGSSAPYRLYTHCGVLTASINGQTYYADPPVTDGSGNPPPGWGNPYDDGDMSLRSATAADFHDSAGHTAHFTSPAPGPTPSIPICS
jgi:hypothetical protein